MAAAEARAAEYILRRYVIEAKGEVRLGGRDDM
jgi:hypothetical protein